MTRHRPLDSATASHAVPFTGTELVGSAAAMMRSMVRPRRPDLELLNSLPAHGLPKSEVTVELTALPQNPGRVPAWAIAEGLPLLSRLGNSMQSFVIGHPDVTILVDPAVCDRVGERVMPDLPQPLRMLVSPAEDVISTRSALSASPKPDFALATHAHWDHVSGLLDLPGLPLHLSRVDLDWVGQGVRAPVGGVRSALRDRSVTGFELDGRPYLSFAASHDLLGDGSVVAVDLHGHTPGSVGYLVRTTQGTVLLAGDAAWHSQQVSQLRQRPGFPGCLVDHDREKTWHSLHRLHAAARCIPVIPAHDHGAAEPHRRQAGH